MCSGGGGSSVPLDQRTDADLQQLVSMRDNALANADPALGPFGSINPWAAIQIPAANDAERILNERKAQRAEIERIANERNALLASQQAESQRLQQAQAQAAFEQQRTVAELQAQEKEQQQRIQQARVATQAVASSMRVLQGGTASSSAPTAPLSPRKTRERRPAASGSSLRIGQTAASQGVGLNIGG